MINREVQTQLFISVKARMSLFCLQIKHMHKQTLAARSRGLAFKCLYVCTSPLSCQCGLILQKFLCILGSDLNPLWGPSRAPSTADVLLTLNNFDKNICPKFRCLFHLNCVYVSRLVPFLLTDGSACMMYMCAALICLPYLP